MQANTRAPPAGRPGRIRVKRLRRLTGCASAASDEREAEERVRCTRVLGSTPPISHATPISTASHGSSHVRAHPLDYWEHVERFGTRTDGISVTTTAMLQPREEISRSATVSSNKGYVDPNAPVSSHEPPHLGRDERGALSPLDDAELCLCPSRDDSPNVYSLSRNVLSLRAADGLRISGEAKSRRR